MKRCTALSALSVAALLIAATMPARAHDLEKGPNGGPMIENKGHHLELVVKGAELVVHLTDANHAAITSAGATGRAVILEGKEQQTATLTVREPNLLAATLPAALKPGARVVVSAKLGNGSDLLARFVVK